LSRDRTQPLGGRDRRRSTTVQAALSRPSARQLSRRAREQLQQRLLLGAAGAIGLLVLSIVGFGAFKELVWFPSQPVAVVFGDTIPLRTYTAALSDQMHQLQAQVAQANQQNQSNPNAASGSIEKLINAQETLPEDVLDQQIETAIIVHEARVRGISVASSEIDGKINEQLAQQRAIFNAPTATPTETATPRPTATDVPEGFVPTAIPTRTETPDPQTPTAVPSPTPTLDPLTPTLTRTPLPTRPTSTPITTPTQAPTLAPDEFQKAYSDLKAAIKSESSYRDGIEQQLLRDKLREALGASLPHSGPRAHVLRLATSTKDEARVALIQIAQGYPIDQIADDANQHPVENRQSGDLGWVAKGAESQEFDDVVFSDATPLNDWTDPFAVGNHFEIVDIVAREADGPYDDVNMEKMKDRNFQEWLNQEKQSPEIVKELSPQERQWAVDRASKGIFSTTGGTGSSSS